MEQEGNGGNETWRGGRRERNERQAKLWIGRGRKRGRGGERGRKKEVGTRRIAEDLGEGEKERESVGGGERGRRRGRKRGKESGGNEGWPRRGEIGRWMRQVGDEEGAEKKAGLKREKRKR